MYRVYFNTASTTDMQQAKQRAYRLRDAPLEARALSGSPSVSDVLCASPQVCMQVVL